MTDFLGLSALALTLGLAGAFARWVWQPHTPARADSLGSLSALAVAVVLVVGCAPSGPDPSLDPLDADVPGAAETTDWLEGDGRLWLAGSEPQPDAEQAVSSFLQRVRGTFAEIDLRSELSGPDDDGVYRVIARGAFPPSDLPLRAVDFRFEVRQSEGGWVVDALEERHHCSEAPARPFCS